MVPSTKFGHQTQARSVSKKDTKSITTADGAPVQARFDSEMSVELPPSSSVVVGTTSVPTSGVAIVVTVMLTSMPASSKLVAMRVARESVVIAEMLA
eukprot:CAMPEP_0206441758 /NCGR_PEP_ID=MMETSP0324_2-20121206/13451_1 /ASSEMBLY_ACC=CAM_ASM_000836 /TAXON_ID=2866 /ORGANISM="Crypthecodinium cohnii, Strain Seligo" /LENGTH=96 /DNA_ID=CAMNT_0053909539 /DNA_START=537 /DNA_END=823 /DNA_ORIENTATION=+